MKKLPILLLIATMCACMQSPANSSSSKEKTDPSVNNVPPLFEEGSINVRISTPGNPLGELLEHVDLTRGDAQRQLEESGKKLDAADRAKLEKISKKNPMLMLALVFLPWKSQIFVKSGQATAKFDAVTYHGENTVNLSTASGQVFMYGHSNKTNAVTFNYTKNELGESTMQSQLSDKEYDIKYTNDKGNVAGFECKKNIYTLKDLAPIKSTEIPAMGNTKIARLEVFTSDKMSQAVNFVHPIYVNEKGGIMKIKIFYSGAEDFPIVYEFLEVEPRKITSEEIAIQQSAPIYDYGKDVLTLGTKLMGIMFSGAQ